MVFEILKFWKCELLNNTHAFWKFGKLTFWKKKYICCVNFAILKILKFWKIDCLKTNKFLKFWILKFWNSEILKFIFLKVWIFNFENLKFWRKATWILKLSSLIEDHTIDRGATVAQHAYSTCCCWASLEPSRLEPKWLRTLELTPIGPIGVSSKAWSHRVQAVATPRVRLSG